MVTECMGYAPPRRARSAERRSLPMRSARSRHPRHAPPRGPSPVSRPAPPGTCTWATSRTRSTSGASPARSAAACCCGWRTTTGADAARSTKRPRWRIWSGSDSSRTSAARPSSGAARRPTARATARRLCRRRSEGSARRARMFVCDCSRKDIAAEAGDPFNEETVSGTLPRSGLRPRPWTGIRLGMEPGAERFADGLLGSDLAGARGAMRRPSAPGPAGPVDLSVRRRGGRLAARGGSGDPRRGPAALDGTPDPAGPPVGPGAATGVPAPSADQQAGRRQAEQGEWRHRHSRIETGRSVAERCSAGRPGSPGCSRSRGISRSGSWPSCSSVTVHLSVAKGTIGTVPFASLRVT